jgi:flagellin-like hook-associated protein FlgL
VVDSLSVSLSGPRKEQQMTMRINSDISASLIFNNQRTHSSRLEESITRLSTGLRVNSGADDAAGITISEKIRGQIRGLNQAINNMQSGVSLLQTADSAMQESGAMLNRLRELSIQSMDDALTNEDRLEIQKEADQLVDEIDRIATTTEFNTKKILDGSAAAIITTSNQGTEVFASGGLDMDLGGAYQVKVDLSSAGDSTIVRSNIMQSISGGRTATNNTDLKDIAAFYDSESKFVLETDQNLLLRYQGNEVNLTVTQHQTLDELASMVQEAVRRDVSQGGLGLANSRFVFDEGTGQLVYTGTNGGAGNEVGFFASSDFLQALGMEAVNLGTEDQFNVRLIGADGVEDVSISGNRAQNLLSGIDVDFERVEQAQISSAISSEAVVRITQPTTFQLSDTDTHAAVNINASRRTLIDNISLNAGTYTLDSLAARINAQINTGAVATRLGVQAVVTDNRLELVATTVTGETSEIRISNGTGDTERLFGGSNLLVTGSGGTQSAYVTGGPVMKNGFTTTNARRNVTIRINQMTDREIPNTIYNGPTYAVGTFLSGDQILKDHQDLLASTGLPLEAYWADNGRLAFRHTGKGTDTGFRILRSGNAFITNSNPTGAGAGYAVRGSGGVEARLGIQAEAYDEGYGFDGAFNFALRGQGGVESEVIRVYAQSGQVPNSNSAFAWTKSQIVSVFDAAGLDKADTGYRFNQEGRLEFISLSGGKYSRVGFEAKDTNTANTRARVLTGFGVDLLQMASGQGENLFDVHVAARALNFQIGANQRQSIQFSMRNMSSSTLDIQDLDLTQFSKATVALGKIDRAIQTISSQRASIGSVINRINHAQASASTYKVNLTSADSQIRDLDLALETVAQTRSSLLKQSGVTTFQMHQANRRTALQSLINS